MRDFSTSHDALSNNTATVRKQWPLDRIIDECARRQIRAISPWRDQVAAVGIARIERQLRDSGIKLSGYCRGGFFPAANPAGLRAALDDNRRAIDEAKRLDAPCLVLVVGSLPGALGGTPAYLDIARARGEVRDGIAATLEYARDQAMPLAIEPLHPMQAAERACINTLEQALDLCDELDPGRSGALGIAVDLYHVWWDPKLEAQITRAGADTRSRKRPRDDGRRRHRTPKMPALDRRRGLFGLRRSRDLLRLLVAKARRGSARHLHRTAHERRLNTPENKA